MMLSLRSFFRDTNTYTTDAEHSTPSPSTHTLSPIENIFKRRLRVKIECPKPDISLVPPIPLFHVIVICKCRDVSPFCVLISEPRSHPNETFNAVNRVTLRHILFIFRGLCVIQHFPLSLRSIVQS